MKIRGLAFMPLLWVTWSLLGLCALVALTMILGHEKRPYISDTGKAFPESVVYMVVFLVSSIIGAGVASIQYKFMILRCEPSEKRYIIFQRVLYVIGWTVCIGTAINAIFSVKTGATAHRIGAGLAFVFGALYNLCQAACLYKRSFSSRRMCHFRLALALVTIVILLICILYC
ncbi:DNA damage-regulated autophagy modulator protein 1-like [Leptodactylus fuscus]|uniref:DNA damage-regulated autophagy modulator protein 1-like n=1 Tax=Leptodactylus fuscus TaxID=238119 RepID=UPI003F4EC11A